MRKIILAARCDSNAKYCDELLSILARTDLTLSIRKSLSKKVDSLVFAIFGILKGECLKVAAEEVLL